MRWPSSSVGADARRRQVGLRVQTVEHRPAAVQRSRAGGHRPAEPPRHGGTPVFDSVGTGSSAARRRGTGPRRAPAAPASRGLVRSVGTRPAGVVTGRPSRSSQRRSGGPSRQPHRPPACPPPAYGPAGDSRLDLAAGRTGQRPGGAPVRPGRAPGLGTAGRMGSGRDDGVRGRDERGPARSDSASSSRWSVTATAFRSASRTCPRPSRGSVPTALTRPPAAGCGLIDHPRRRLGRGPPVGRRQDRVVRGAGRRRLRDGPARLAVRRRPEGDPRRVRGARRRPRSDAGAPGALRAAHGTWPRAVP